MNKLETCLVDKIATSCNELFSKFPKTGKPVEKEWTVLSCVLKYMQTSADIEVVAAGTGSKCIGASKLDPQGDILNDSHAEVMARRGFLLYIYDQINRAIDAKESIFTVESDKFKLKDGILFMFYSSQLPCGDASIIPIGGHEDDFGTVLKSQKRKADLHIFASETKIRKEEFTTTKAKCALIENDLKREEQINDIHRTGAKCLPEGEQDPKMPGVDYHICAQVRTKPGRGDPTLSVSCSDKMARWVHVGIQGALLDILLEQPIYISSFIFGSGVPFSKESLKRAFLLRNVKNCDEIKVPILPEFYQSSVIFDYVRKEQNIRPTAGSIVWVRKSNPLPEVAVQGKKLGVTKKKLNSPTSALSISKRNVYTNFINILTKTANLKRNIIEDNLIEKVAYNEMKRKSRRYLDQWKLVKQNFFKTWTVKPDIWNFCVEN